VYRLAKGWFIFKKGLMKVFHRWLLSGLLLVPLFFMTAGCRQHRATMDDAAVPRLHLEARGGFGSERVTPVEMPVSGSTFGVVSEPLVNEFEIANVELVKVELGMALMFQLDEAGARKLYRASVSNRGSRVVLMVSGVPLGARVLEETIQNGVFFTFTELPDSAMEQLVLDLRDTLERIQQKRR
jgi:hypothetical protein